MSSAQAAKQYIERGIAITPVEGKRPILNDWQNTEVTAADIARYWDNNGHNCGIGIRLGAPSNGLVDVDLDCPEAVIIAGRFLPPTLTSGRMRARHSHWWYLVPGAETTKYKDLDGAMLVELRSTGCQTVVFGTHPDGDQYLWHSDSGLAIEPVERGNLVRSIKELATATLIGRHLPPVGGRHDFALALVGFLARRLDDETVGRIVHAAWDVAGGAGREAHRDLDGIVHDTREKLEASQHVVGAPTLDETAPGVSKQITRWWGWRHPDGDLSAEELRTHETKTPRENPILAGRVLLAQGIEEGVEPPEELEPGVLLKGKVHQVYAGPGSGKTMLALWLIKRRVEQEEKVLFFDHENGLRIVSERLAQMGIDTTKVDECLVYLPSPNLPLTSEVVQAYRELLEDVKPDLVVFDSWINFLASAGMDENTSNDIARWAVAFTHPARDRGITVLLLDHVPHEGSHARGSTRKKDEVDVQWRLFNTKPFDRDSTGEVVLHREKDREGWLPPSVRFSVGGGEDGGFVFSRSSGTLEEPGGDGLIDSHRKALQVLRSFGEKGARYSEWKSSCGLAGSTFDRAISALTVRGLTRKAQGRYFANPNPEPPHGVGVECGLFMEETPNPHEPPHNPHRENGGAGKSTTTTPTPLSSGGGGGRAGGKVPTEGEEIHSPGTPPYTRENEFGTEEHPIACECIDCTSPAPPGTGRKGWEAKL